MTAGESQGSHNDATRNSASLHGDAASWRDVSRTLRAGDANGLTRQALEAANAQLQDQALELELSNQQMQDSAVELEMQSVELQSATAALEERTDAAERARRDAERAQAHLTRTFAQAPVAVAVVEGPTHRFTLANDAYRAIVLDRDLLGLAVHEAFPELDGQGIHELLDGVYNTGEPVVVREMTLYLEAHGKPERDAVVLDFTYQPLRDDDGAVYGITVVAVDITAQVAARKLVEASERQLQTLADAIPTLAWTARADGFIDWYNARWFEYTGTTPADMEGWGWQSVHDPAALPAVLERWQASIRQGHPFEMTFPLRGADGAFRAFLTRVMPLKDSDGRVIRWFGTNTDVEAEREARASAERAVERTVRLQALTEALAGARTVADVATVVVSEGRQVMGAKTAVFILRVPGSTEAVIAQHSGVPPAVLRDYGRFDISRPGPAAEVLRTGEPIFVDSSDGASSLRERFPEIPQIWEELGAHALAALPLVIADEVAASTSFTFEDSRVFSAEDRAFLLAFARQGAQALERARLLEGERAAVAAVRDRDARLNFAMDVAALGAWELDVETKSAWRSRRHDQIFGYDEGIEHWTYDLFLDHVHADDREQVDASFRTTLASGAPWDFTCRIRRADGQERWIAGRGEATTDERGRISRLLGVVRDITAEKDAELALRAAKEQSETANRAKSDFLASMSHELRTPLNAIGGYTDLLLLGIRGPITPAQAEDLSRIQRSQQHLLGLINDVLNVVRLDSGQIHYSLRDFPVTAAMTRVEELILPQLQAKGLAYMHVPCDASLLVRADEEKLRQILVNLLTNATKFTEAGRIDFWCDPSTAADDETVRIHVRDTGSGIPAHLLETIFEPFVQVGRKLNRPSEGVGLGLAISRDLARGMHGDLDVVSTEGVGSTFTLTLPRAAAPSP